MKLLISTPSDLDRLVAFLRSKTEPVVVEVKAYRDTRSNEQNRRLWAMLRDVSQQVNWYGNHLKDHEWKDVFTASLKQQRAVPGIDGGFVVLGSPTSKMTIAEMTELIELMMAFGCERGVMWSDPLDPVNSEVA